MGSAGHAARFGGRRRQDESRFLADAYFPPERRGELPEHIAELAAASPFTQEAGDREAWTIGDLPLRVTRRIFKVPEGVRPGAQAACGVFLSADSSKEYEKFITPSTTGRATLFVNGRYWGGAKPKHDEFEAFNTMQEAVEGLKAGHALLLAAWMLDPSLPLTKTNASGVNALGNRTWGQLFQRKARDGVKIRILMTDFSSIFRDQHDKLYRSFLPALDALIAALPAASRDNLKYVVSLHPATHLRVHVATHHQKFMVLKIGDATTAFCGGLDIAFMRTPAYWGRLTETTYRWLWHDIHGRLEGLITNDLEREFVMRWNREKDHSMVASRPGWKPFETLGLSSPTSTDRSAARNAQHAQMLRTVSTQGAGRNIQNTRRDDIWQGHLRLIGCASRILYMENQYFREPRMADAIVKQAKAQPDLVVLVVVPSETDDRPDPGKRHGDFRQHEFFVRLTNGVPAGRLRVYTMFHRIIHSKLIMADDRALCVGSANANPRGFFLDSELNVMLDDPEAVTAFRHRLWAHNLGVAEATVAAWAASAFIARWDAVAAANAKLRSSPEQMTGEAIIPFEALKEKGERQPLIDDVETELPGAGVLADAGRAAAV